MAISRSVAGNNARPARVIGYIRAIPPLVFLVDHGHVRSHRLGEGGHHQVNGGLPRSGSRLHVAVVRLWVHPFPEDIFRTRSIWIRG